MHVNPALLYEIIHHLRIFSVGVEPFVKAPRQIKVGRFVEMHCALGRAKKQRASILIRNDVHVRSNLQRVKIGNTVPFFMHGFAKPTFVNVRAPRGRERFVRWVPVAPRILGHPPAFVQIWLLVTVLGGNASEHFSLARVVIQDFVAFSSARNIVSFLVISVERCSAAAVAGDPLCTYSVVERVFIRAGYPHPLEFFSPALVFVVGANFLPIRFVVIFEHVRRGRLNGVAISLAKAGYPLSCNVPVGCGVATRRARVEIVIPIERISEARKVAPRQVGVVHGFGVYLCRPLNFAVAQQMTHALNFVLVLPRHAVRIGVRVVRRPADRHPVLVDVPT